MRAPILVVLALLAVAGGLAFWLSDDATPITPPNKTEAAQRPNEGKTQTAAATTHRTAVASDDGEGGGNKPATNSSWPHAKDAVWTDIHVVDQSGAALPGAMVYWFDDGSSARMHADTTITGALRSILYGKPCQLSEHYGWSVQADAEGKARVTISDPTHIAGKANGLFGRMTITPTTAVPPDGFRLVLRQDDTVRVLVLDENDVPCKDVPITIMAVNPGNEVVGEFGHYAMAITGTDGIAELVHVQQWRRRLKSNADLDSIEVRTFVHMLLPHVEELGAPIDLSALPEDTIVVRMPSCGTARVRIDVANIEVGHEIVITADGKSRFDGYTVGLPGKDGWAHFANLPILKRYRAHSLASADINEAFDGPAFHGDAVDVVIRAPTDSVVLRAQILDDARKPVATQHLRAEFSGKGLPHYRHFTTDEQGGALISIPMKGSKPIELESIKITAILPNTGYGTGHVGPRVLQTGLIDLGNIVLERGKLVAAGQLMNGSEPYTQEIFASLQTFIPNAPENTPAWRAIHVHVVSIDENGHFEVHANLAGGEHRLHFGGEHNRPVDPVPFRVGDHNIIVQVPIGYPLGASFLLPESIDPEAVQCQLVSTTSNGNTSQPKEYKIDPHRSQGERCSLEWRGLPAGTYTLELALWARPKPLVRVTEIVLPLPRTGDARLTDIDLRNLVQSVTVNLLEPDGTPCEGYGAMFSADQMVAGKWKGHPVFGSSTRLLLPPGPVNLNVLLEGYQPAPVRGSGPKINVRVFPWPTVTIRLAEPAQLPKGLELRMSLESSNPVDGMWHGPNQEDHLMPLLGIETFQPKLKDTEIKFQIAEGAHRVRLFVSRGDRSVEVHGTTPTQILPTERNVSLRVPKVRLQAAIDAISK